MARIYMHSFNDFELDGIPTLTRVLGFVAGYAGQGSSFDIVFNYGAPLWPNPQSVYITMRVWAPSGAVHAGSSITIRDQSYNQLIRIVQNGNVYDSANNLIATGIYWLAQGGWMGTYYQARLVNIALHLGNPGSYGVIVVDEKYYPSILSHQKVTLYSAGGYGDFLPSPDSFVNNVWFNALYSVVIDMIKVNDNSGGGWETGYPDDFLIGEAPPMADGTPQEWYCPVDEHYVALGGRDGLYIYSPNDGLGGTDMIHFGDFALPDIRFVSIRFGTNTTWPEKQRFYIRAVYDDYVSELGPLWPKQAQYSNQIVFFDAAPTGNQWTSAVLNDTAFGVRVERIDI